MSPSLLQGKRGIFLLHHRKAGGTTLRQILRNRCDELGLAFEVFEGAPLDVRFLSDEWVTVTSFREPMARIRSLYFFDGRWPRRAIAESKPVEFHEWIHRKDRTLTKMPLWECVDNYYIRSLLGIEPIDKKIQGHDLDQAKLMLLQFDLTLITGQLSTPATRSLLKVTLGIEEDMPDIKLLKPFQGPSEDRDKVVIEQAGWTELETLNDWDKSLFRFAQDRFQEQLVSGGFV